MAATKKHEIKWFIVIAAFYRILHASYKASYKDKFTSKVLGDDYSRIPFSFKVSG